jgi:hypothetical protein
MAIDRQIVFYTLLFSLFYIFSKASYILACNFKVRTEFMLVLSGILFALTIFGLSFLFNTSIDNFHFELTPIKYCEGGAYMRSSSPEKQALCSHFTKQEIENSQCYPPGLFNGLPIHYKRSADTDGKWNNSEMQINNSYDYPQVL